MTGITDSVFGNHTYAYDSRGFLTSADDETYEYDANGNITKLGDTVLTYGGIMKDRLTSVNGKAIAYANNSSINPTSWDGITFTFEGRRLINFSRTKSVSFKYNDMGLRTRKEVGKSSNPFATLYSATDYYYDRDKLVSEICRINTTSGFENRRLDFLYDENGSLYGFVYNKTDKYFYVRDGLENILGIIDSNGNLVVQYTYNAWGEIYSVAGISATTIGEYNHFRYKGYYYDTETAMYYCQSRYYVPSWGRWLNSDHPHYLNPSEFMGMNLYAYCGNNPVMYTDPSGTFSWLIALILIGCTAIGAGIGGKKAYDRAVSEGKTGSDLALATLGGVLLGGSIGLAVGGAIVATVSALSIPFLGITSTKLFGIPLIKAFAIGALAFDFTAFVAMPLIGVSMSGIEYDPKPTPTPKPGESPIPPWARPLLDNSSVYEDINISIYF